MHSFVPKSYRQVVKRVALFRVNSTFRKFVEDFGGHFLKVQQCLHFLKLLEIFKMVSNQVIFNQKGLKNQLYYGQI